MTQTKTKPVDDILVLLRDRLDERERKEAEDLAYRQRVNWSGAIRLMAKCVELIQEDMLIRFGIGCHLYSVRLSMRTEPTDVTVWVDVSADDIPAMWIWPSQDWSRSFDMEVEIDPSVTVLRYAFEAGNGVSPPSAETVRMVLPPTMAGSDVVDEEYLLDYIQECLPQ